MVALREWNYENNISMGIIGVIGVNRVSDDIEVACNLGVTKAIIVIVFMWVMLVIKVIF